MNKCALQLSLCWYKGIKKWIRTPLNNGTMMFCAPAIQQFLSLSPLFLSFSLSLSLFLSLFLSLHVCAVFFSTEKLQCITERRSLVFIIFPPLVYFTVYAGWKGHKQKKSIDAEKKARRQMIRARLTLTENLTRKKYLWHWIWAHDEVMVRVAGPLQEDAPVWQETVFCVKFTGEENNEEEERKAS